MIQMPIELRVARAQAAGQHAGQIAAQGELVSAITFVTMAETGTIDEVTATEHIDSFAPWKPHVKYKEGNLRVYGDNEHRKLYRCISNHTSQDDWTPDISVSLWTIAGDPEVEFPAWSQPIGAHDAYDAGDKVSHNYLHWISDADDNVWEPGVYGWTQVE